MCYGGGGVGSTAGVVVLAHPGIAHPSEPGLQDPVFDFHILKFVLLRKGGQRVCVAVSGHPVYVRAGRDKFR